MPTHDEHIRRILRESGEPLFVSDITQRLNAELVSGPAFDTTEVVKHLQSLYDQGGPITGWALDVEAVDTLTAAQASQLQPRLEMDRNSIARFIKSGSSVPNAL